jgi:hypothetical protein
MRSVGGVAGWSWVAVISQKHQHVLSSCSSDSAVLVDPVHMSAYVLLGCFWPDVYCTDTHAAVCCVV